MEKGARSHLRDTGTCQRPLLPLQRGNLCQCAGQGRAESRLQHNRGLSHSWRRNLDGSIIRKSLKKMLEVLVAQYPLSDVWALPGVRAGVNQLAQKGLGRWGPAGG